MPNTASLKLATLALVPLVSATAFAQRADSVWTIRAGTFAGQSLPIDVSVATRRGSPFLRISKLKGDARYVGWSISRLPAPVAFRRGRGVSEADSIAFWSILRRMEADMGMRLFEPHSLGTDIDPQDVIIVDTRTMPGQQGVTYVTWSMPGGIYDARVYLRSSEMLHNSHVVTHEMMHALGFGHTSMWESVMNSGSGSPAHLTPQDVAYAQFAMESRSNSERGDMWQRLALAMEREPREDASRDAYVACAFSSVRFKPAAGRLARVEPATVDQPHSASCYH